MPRKRERFERSDVPKDTPYRNLIGLIVLLIIGGLGYLAFKFLWGRVSIEARMGDTMIHDALDEQTGHTALSGDFSYIDNPIEKILFLQVDDPDAEHPYLISAELLLMDPIDGSAHRFDVPTNLNMNIDGSSYTVGEYFDTYGPAASIPAIFSTYNITGNHVIMGTSTPWADIEGLDGENQLKIVDVAGPFVESMRTDLEPGEVIDHAALFKELGVSDLRVEDTPTLYYEVEEGAEPPSTVSVDLVSFGIQGGILIPYGSEDDSDYEDYDEDSEDFDEEGEDGESDEWW